MFVAASDNYVGRSIVEYGEWSQSEIRVLEQIIQPGMVVLDIGANVGYHTLAFSKAVGPTGHVISFEPQPAIFELLAANITINELGNVRALNMALGDTRGLVDMPQLDYEVSQNFGAFRVREFLRDEKAPISYTPVTLLRLDDIAPARNASVLKLDVEGMELAVLRGGSELIQKRRPVIFAENHLPGNDSEKLLSFFEEINYDCYWQVSSSFEKNNFNKNSNNIFGNESCVNNLAIPREVASNIAGMRKVKDPTDHPYIWNAK
ncbi:MAG: FkbM family methyltransferase [Rhizobiaceae bacterium]|nr:FkbM family methyltransferase [Rhizobiaceae bacterium]